MEHKKDKEELEEEMRILYVATTRAQQQMHIVDCILSLEPYRHPLTTSDIYKRKGYTAWILQAFLSMQSPLFTLKEVHHLWENQVQTKQATTYKKLPIYTKEASSWRLSTASEQNINTTEPVSYTHLVGDKAGFLKAQIDFALDRNDLHDVMVDILKNTKL